MDSPKAKAENQRKAVFDLRGGSCGWCILKIKSLLKSMQPGDRLEVLITDPTTVEDLAAVLAAGNDRLVDSVEEDGFNRLFLQKN